MPRASQTWGTGASGAAQKATKITPCERAVRTLQPGPQERSSRPLPRALTLVLAVLYVALELLAQHRLYCSVFRLADVTLLPHFLELREHVARRLPLASGTTPKPLHHNPRNDDQGKEHRHPNRKLRSRGGTHVRRKKRERRHRFADANLPTIMQVSPDQSSFGLWGRF